MERLCIELDMPKIGTYHGRHSFSSIAINNGVKVTELMDALGHSSLITTQNYINSISDVRYNEISGATTSFLN